MELLCSVMSVAYLFKERKRKTETMKNHHTAEFSLANEFHGAEAFLRRRQSLHCQEIPRLLRNLKAHYSLLKTQQLDRILMCVTVCNMVVSLRLGIVSH